MGMKNFDDAVLDELKEVNEMVKGKTIQLVYSIHQGVATKYFMEISSGATICFSHDDGEGAFWVDKMGIIKRQSDTR